MTVAVDPAAERADRRTTPPLAWVVVALGALTALLIPAGPVLPLAVIVGVGALVVTLGNIWAGLLLTIAVTVLLPEPFSVQAGPVSLSIGRGLLFVLVLGWIGHLRDPRRRVVPRRTPFDAPLLAVITVLLASVIVNLPVLSRYEIVGGIRKVALFAVDFGLLFAVTVSVLRDRERVHQLLRFVGTLIGFTAVLGLVERFTSKNVFSYAVPYVPHRLGGYIQSLSQAAVLTRGSISRVHSTFEQPLGFAIMLLLGLPIAVAFALSAADRAGQLRWAITSAVIFGALLFTASRAAYLIALLTLVTFLVLTPDARLRLRVLFVALALSGILLTQHDVRRTMIYFFQPHHGTQLEGSLGSRVSAAQSTVALVRRRPILGYGAHTFSEDELVRNQLLPHLDNLVLDDAYLGHTAESGFVGLLALAALLGCAWVSAWRAFHRAALMEDRLVALGLLAGVQSWIVMAFFADLYQFNAPPRVFFVLLGAIAVLRLENQTTGTDQPLPVGAATA